MNKRQLFILVKEKSARFLILCVLSACVFLPQTKAQSSNNLLEADTMREDFQGEGLGQFASYPPAQDIGYEPSITPTGKFDPPGGRALMRVVQPTRAGNLRFGFIKKVEMVSSVDARLSFSYRINAPNGNPTIEIGIAGADGNRYTKEINAAPNGWTKAEIRLSELQHDDKRALEAGVGIEAIYMVANLKNADADITYRFLIDDVSLSAERAAQFKINTPPAETFEPWSSQISAKGFKANDTISIKAAAPAKLAQADCIVKTSDGQIITTQKLYDDGTHGDKKAGDKIWSNEAIYKLGAKDESGVWNAELNGKTPNGKTVSTDLRFIVHPAKTNAHPRLFFDSNDKEKLLARMRDPRVAKIWEYVQTTAKTAKTTGDLAHGGDVFELLDKEYLLPSLLGYFDVLNRARYRISYNAFIAYLTDDAEARAAAKNTLLAVARWQHWEPPWFSAHGQHTYYPAGQLAADVALGYDLLYDSLSESERSLVRRALIEKSIVPTYKEYFLDNRAMANTSNWISHTVGGALIAASAIADDVKPDESDGKFDLYVNGLLLKIEAHIAASFLPDGSYGEGISYHEFDSETLAPMTIAARRAFGIDYWKTTHVKDSLGYALYTLTEPKEASLDMGDTHPPGGHGIPALVYQSKDPVLRWYYARFERPSLQQFIFYDDSVQPQSPTDAKLPTSRIFKDKGNAVFRTGWGAEEIAMLFRAGANFNHHHADQGAFLISAFGEPLVTEAGWSDYYKDPYYATFFTQAAGHNTILVDGNPESQTIPDTPQFKALDEYPRITDSITSEFYDGVGSELSSVYQNRLARYMRRIVFVKPHYFVVFDDLKANGKPAQFDFLLHLPNRADIKTEELTAIYNGEKASLAVRSFAPGGAKLSIENGRIPYPVFSARTPAVTPAQPAYLDFKTTKPLGEAQFLTAIVPAKTESAARNLIGQMTEITGENLKGIRVTRGSEIDSIMFRAGAGNALAMRQGDWLADASVLTVTESANNLKMFAVQIARVLRRGKQILFSSESPMSVAANINANEITAVCSADAATKITLFVGKKPVRVLLDGKELSANAFNFNRADGTISLNVPAEQHEIQILK